MTNLNATLNADEIALDDLFAEIDASLPEIVEASPAEPTEPAVEALDGLDDADLDALMGEIEPAVEPAVEVVEPTAEPEPAPTTAETVLATVEDELDGLFDESDIDESLLSLDDLVIEDVPAVAPDPVKKKSPKKKAVATESKSVDDEPKADDQPVEDAPAEDDAPKAEPKKKEPATPRTTYVNASKSKVLLDRLSGDTSELVLEFDDVDLPPEELAKKQRAFLAVLNNQPATTTNGQTVQKKVAEKVVILFTMFKQKKGWNEVMYRTFKLLLTDGYIQSGDKGNLVQELLKKPYSIGTARAQAGQMMQMLPLLKIATETSKGRLEINENSTILHRLRNDYFADLQPKADAA